MARLPDAVAVLLPVWPHVTPGRVCVAHEHADPLCACGRPVPIESHPVRPLARGGDAARAVRLCAPSRAAVHRLLDVIEVAARAVPSARWVDAVRLVPASVLASFGGAERVIACKGWRTYAAAFLAGRYDIHFRLWRTDGSPKTPDVPSFAEFVGAVAGPADPL